MIVNLRKPNKIMVDLGLECTFPNECENWFSKGEKSLYSQTDFRDIVGLILGYIIK